MDVNLSKSDNLMPDVLSYLDEWTAAFEKHFDFLTDTIDIFRTSGAYSETKIATADNYDIVNETIHVVIYSYKSPYNHKYFGNEYILLLRYANILEILIYIDISISRSNGLIN